MPDPASELIARAETMAREAAAGEYPHNKRLATGLAEDVILPALLRAMADALDNVRDTAKARSDRYRSEYGGYPQAAAHNQGAEIASEALEDEAEELASALRAAAEGGDDA